MEVETVSIKEVDASAPVRTLGQRGKFIHPSGANNCLCSEKHATIVVVISRKEKESKKLSRWRKETSQSRSRRKADPKALRKFRLSS